MTKTIERSFPSYYIFTSQRSVFDLFLIRFIPNFFCTNIFLPDDDSYTNHSNLQTTSAQCFDSVFRTSSIIATVRIKYHFMFDSNFWEKCNFDLKVTKTQSLFNTWIFFLFVFFKKTSILVV